jgi:hypothetical protein
MTDFNQPTFERKTIIKALLYALIMGVVVLVTAVLPAEYGIDPTGAGKFLGFSKLYQPVGPVNDEVSTQDQIQKSIKVLTLEKAGSQPDVAKPKEANNPPPAKQYDAREDTIKITIAGGKGLEYKVLLQKYGSMKYEWITDKGILFFDFHGEVEEANPPKDVFYESYTVAYSNNMVGTFLAPFEGRHGWYFKNLGTTDMIVSLRLKGEYHLEQ